MLDKTPAAMFRELRWLANYYEASGQKEKAREVRDSLVNFFIRNNQQNDGTNADYNNEQNTGTDG